jgi:hypothetical protein
MTKLSILSLLISVFSTITLSSQTTSIKLNLFENERKLETDFTVSVYQNQIKMNIEVRDSILIIPDTLYGRKVDLVVSTKKYVLNFYDLIIGWNKEYLCWRLYLDLPPFDRDWVIKGKLKKYKWIYAIDRSSGTTITYYGKYGSKFNPSLRKTSK